MFQDLRKAFVYLFILPFRESVRTASFDAGGKKVTQIEHEEIHSKIPSKHDKKLSTTETNWKDFFFYFGASLFILYTIHPYTCDTNLWTCHKALKHNIPIIL